MVDVKNEMGLCLDPNMILDNQFESYEKVLILGGGGGAQFK